MSIVVCLSPRSLAQKDSDVIEVEVQAHVRRYRRHRYHKTCQCSQTPGIITAPEPAKLIRKGKLGISVWVEILLHKYAFGIPINRQLQDFRVRGLNLSQGTVTGGLQIIKPLFEPVVDAIRERVIEEQNGMPMKLAGWYGLTIRVSKSTGYGCLW